MLNNITTKCKIFNCILYQSVWLMLPIAVKINWTEIQYPIKKTCSPLFHQFLCIIIWVIDILEDIICENCDKKSYGKVYWKTRFIEVVQEYEDPRTVLARQSEDWTRTYLSVITMFVLLLLWNQLYRPLYVGDKILDYNSAANLARQCFGTKIEQKD